MLFDRVDSLYFRVEMRTLAVLGLLVSSVQGTIVCSQAAVTRITQECISQGQREVDSLQEYEFDPSLGEVHELWLKMRERDAINRLFKEAESTITSLCGDGSFIAERASSSLSSEKAKYLDEIASFFGFRIREAARFDAREDLDYLMERKEIKGADAREMATRIFRLMHEAIENDEYEYWESKFETDELAPQMKRLGEAMRLE